MKKLALAAVLSAICMLVPATAWAGWNDSWVKIMLDPGHGGSDPGAGTSGYPYEHELVLRCALSANEWLTSVGAQTKMTRTGNYDVSLSTRRQESITYDPWIFCSIHLNAFNGTAHGTETWYYWTSNTRSLNLATYVQNQLVAKMGRTNRGVKQNGWTVITGAEYIPAILTEGLFVDNVEENNLISNPNSWGYKAWVNAHLKGFYDFILSSYEQGRHSTGGLDVNPDVNPFGAETKGISTNPERVTFSCALRDQPSQTVSVSGWGLSDNISVWASDGNAIGLSTTSLGSGGGNVTVTLKDTQTSGSREHRVYFKSGDIQKEVVVAATVTGGVVGTMQEVFNLSQQRGTQNNKGYDAANIRNFHYADGKLYCVYNHNEILVLHAQTGELLGKLKTNDLIGPGALPLCDVKYNNGKIVACNLAVSGQTLRLYCWDNDNADPRLLFETTDFQGATRIGDCLELSGTVDSDCWYAFANDNGSVSRIIEYHQTGTGNWSAKNTEVGTGQGAYVSLGNTCRAYPWGGTWWVDGSKCSPLYVQWSNDHNKAICVAVNDLGTNAQTFGASHHEFYFGGNKYAVGLVFRGSENFTGGKFRLLRDLAGDFTSTDQHQELPADGLGSNKNTNGTGEVMVNTDGDNYLEIWVLSTTQGLAYYKYGDVPVQNPSRPNAKLTVSETDVRVSTKVGTPAVKTLWVGAENIGAGGVNINIDGPGKANWTIEPTHLDAAGEVRATYTPTDLSYDWIWIGAHSDGVESAWSDLHGDSYRDPELEVTGDKVFKSVDGSTDTKIFHVKATDLKGRLFVGLWGNDYDQFSIEHPFDMTENTTIYFDNSQAGWDQVYAWVWDTENPETNINGCEWPGRLMDKDESTGLYKITFTPNDLGHTHGVVFANAANHTKTDDAEVTPGAVYSCAGKVADRWPHALPYQANVDADFTVTYNPTKLGQPDGNIYLATAGRDNTDIKLEAQATTGVDDITATPVAIALVGSDIVVSGIDAEAITVHNAAGMTVAEATHANRLSVADLPAGPYVVAVTAQGHTQSIKIEIKN